MRVLIAPEEFAGTLSAAEAASAIARGWRRQVPADTVRCLPVASAGPGFAGVLAAALGGSVDVVTVAGPLGTPMPVGLVRAGSSVYIESAQACGRGLEPQEHPMRASSLGIGQAITAAAESGARRIVVGLGGVSTLDGGAGLLAGLGATAEVTLDAGPEGLDGITGRVDLSAARARLAGIDLIAAVDETAPLLGLFGAARTSGRRTGLSEEQLWRADRLLDSFVDAVCGRLPSERRIADVPGAGAAGGLGFALAVLGADLRPGVEVVLDALGFDNALAGADLVVTGVGAYDVASRSGTAVFGVAQAAARRARPCIVLAGRVDVGAREMRAMGVESAYALTDLLGESAALADPHGSLEDLARRVARTWSV
ncbi:MAG: glycerate kinase [Aeromicrobium sp.]|uniref:glycerate kinase n=1 Tax=Aeromicrobium sp. TaxID=1871063 RepID=UPI0039E249F3